MGFIPVWIVVFCFFFAPEPPEELRKEKAAAARVGSKVRIPAAVWVLCAAYVLFHICFFNLVNNAALLIQNEGFGDAAQAGLSLSAMTMSSFFGGIAYGFVVKKLKRYTMVQLPVQIHYNEVSFYVCADLSHPMHQPVARSEDPVEKTVPDFALCVAQQLEPFAAHVVGDPLALVMAVTARPLGDAATAALEKALVALGWDERSWCGVALEGATVEQTGSRAALPTLAPDELRLVVEIVDPLAVLALDEDARRALMTAFNSSTTGFLAELAVGRSTQVLGRDFVSVDGFEAALPDAQRKQLVWAQLKQCKRP